MLRKAAYGTEDVKAAPTVWKKRGMAVILARSAGGAVASIVAMDLGRNAPDGASYDLPLSLLRAVVD